MMWGYDGFGFGGGGMGIGMLLFWGLIVFAVIVLVRGFSGSGGPRTRERSAIEILEERYARGEIEKNEFEQKRKDLRGS